MKNLSSQISRRLLRHLSTTATTAAAPSSTITIHKAKHKLQKEHVPDKALEIYSSVSSNSTSPLSSRYAKQLTVQRLAKSRRFDDIETLIESLKNDPKITQEPYFCTLIRCYGKAGMFDHAIKLYDQMEELGTPRSCLSFNALLAAGNNSRVFDRVHQVFDEMPEKYGFDPDKISYGILVKACCEKGEPEMGLKIIEEMDGKGVEVTAVTFTTVLDSLYRIGKVDEAERVWGEMVEKGCVPDVAAWNVKIGHAHAGEPEGVMGLIVEMEGAGLKPDTISYNYLLACYCRNDRLDEAMKVYEDLAKGGFRLKVATFRTLISYLCKKEDYAKGYDVFKRSVFHNKIPDFGTLKVLVEGLVKKKRKKDAKGLIRTVKKRFPPSFTNAWKKVEAELGLLNEEGSANDDAPAV
ncbi:small ribosomal subunit protein mL103 (rPPR7)-like [Silene latifolia]|uniref:small ribosomal subunit protein mL103 (rPPR7)-like n=1 Tax=Silene latifolia TaxID=37657 RepID=UPI003D789336